MTGRASLASSLALFTTGLTAAAAGSFGCVALEPAASTQRDLGQPNGDFPSYDERVTLYATNRARVDPAAEGWPAYAAQPPLLWSFDLNRSARAHSIDMRDTPCFQHNSCDGTDAFARLDGYFTGAWSTMGENISAGRSTSDGFIAVHNWIYEIGAPPGEIGHRENIFAARFTLLGAGFAPGGTQQQNYWTQDFVGAPVTRPRLVDGIHFPRTVSAGGQMTFGITFFDAGNAPPVGLAAVVDGVCAPLTLARGTDPKGAHEAKVPLADGCHPYYFVATVGGTVVTYPDMGALQAPAGSAAASCPLFTTTRVDVRCDGAGGGGAGGSGGAGAMPPGTGGAAPATDDAGDGTVGGGGTPETGSGGAAGSEPDGGPGVNGPAVGGCASGSGGTGCGVAPVLSPARAGAVSLLLAVAGLTVRRRRSR